MNNESTEGWEYLTTENESGDYHHIYEIMSQALQGQWVGYGRSRGGDIREIEEVLALPGGDTEEKTAVRNDALFALLLKYGDPCSYSHDHFGFSYYAGALINEGNYDLDFSYLREALKKAGLEDRLAVRPEDEENLLKNYLLNEDQKDAFRFVPGHYEALDQFAKTTDENIVFIGGDLDPWSAVYIDGGNNPNFKRYILTGKAHLTQIPDFDQDTQDEIVETIKSWVQK